MLQCSALLRYQIFSRDVKIRENREKRPKKYKVEKIICIVTPRTQTVKLTRRSRMVLLTVYKYCHEKLCEELKSPQRKETGPGQGEWAYDNPVHIFS